ncbi:MAG: chromosome partitioning protein ParB [Candidatus Duberdicusella sinuisediminis]|nr:MAG: chromosome partitioning protein ParB [Candidatus Omnitrophota bacterium]
MMEKKVLGKGLDALIPKKEIPLQEYTYIEIDKLKISDYQSRQDLRDEGLKELADSIKSQGIIEPLIVRKKGQDYEIVAGSRRYYACKLLGINKLPVIIKDLTDKSALIFSIAENLQRQDLNPIEEAKSFQRLIEEFGLSPQELSQFLGYDRSTIVNTLRLLNLPEVIQAALRERKISPSSARTLLSLETPEEQLEVFKDLLANKISVRKLEEAVRTKKAKKRVKDPYLKEAEEKLQRALGRKVKIVSLGKRGRLVIEYYSQEDLENLLNFLSSK